MFVVWLTVLIITQLEIVYRKWMKLRNNVDDFYVVDTVIYLIIVTRTVASKTLVSELQYCE